MQAHSTVTQSNPDVLQAPVSQLSKESLEPRSGSGRTSVRFLRGYIFTHTDMHTHIHTYIHTYLHMHADKQIVI